MYGIYQSRMVFYAFSTVKSYLRSLSTTNPDTLMFSLEHPLRNINFQKKNTSFLANSDIGVYKNGILDDNNISKIRTENTYILLQQINLSKYIAILKIKYRMYNESTK